MSSPSHPDSALSAARLRSRALALLPAGTARALEPEEELGPVLHALFEASAQVRARFEISEDDFLQALLRQVSGAGEGVATLRSLHAEDLALAMGCAAGHPVALAEFDQRFGADMSAALRRLDPSPGFIDEAMQAVRERLFLRRERSSPKIASYSGTGPLGGWVRAVTLRAAINLRRGATAEVPLDERLAKGLGTDSAGPELQLIKSQYREAFQQAFRTALDTLTDQELNLLRLHFVGGASQEQLGKLYTVHRVTIARWLTQARERLLLATQRELRSLLKVEPEELEDILELVRSQLAITLTRALRGREQRS
ncbi:sigma-70 family RNA polymerase sigma factor [Hyalangium rubrum]|uniref:Sigma-70 family RNA polymerase sigma factor n=1 Tax=Hyalangium rubrum TaxID=3103134 RepID=A0ABU5H595_9BACT|nr:sigma-70 family RNA polymerase sigma factor [Hyalangium sp. s54d21]MDY7228029.1 sigma-70 family RNA polymerase sigma factor [Hyalangium sp. s54d21]